jgi:hypothetical protein
MKPVLAHLRLLKIILAIYIDDIFNTHRSQKRCATNTRVIIDMLIRLGFTINSKKSIITPSQIMEFLGFIIDSTKMIFKLTEQKKHSIRELCLSIISQKKVKIRTIAKLLGKFTSSFIAVKYGPLHYRYLDHDKTTALKANKGNYNKNMVISEKGREDIQWWIENILHSFNHIGIGSPRSTVTLITDASALGWGGTTGTRQTQGLWAVDDIQDGININVLELKAILFSLKAILRDDTEDAHIRIRSDNTTAVHTINNMGTCRSFECHSVVMDIWEWARTKNNWLTATHIPGVDNDEADELSRNFNMAHEWKLNTKIFQEILTTFNIEPDVDLFASRINYQIDRFVSFRPDPDAFHIDAFTMEWSQTTFYAFPPFACIGRVIRKIISEKASGILITPDWPTQYWYPMLDWINVDKPLIIYPSSRQLHLPNDPGSKHPLWRKLRLAAWKVSGAV